MKRKIFAFLLGAALCFGLISAAHADDTTLNTESGSPKLEYHDPNPTPPPPGSVEEDPDDEPVNPFTDVKPGDFYYDAVLWGLEEGITGGSGKFGPDSICSRGETVTLLWRAAGSPAPASSQSPFTDVRSGDYFYSAVLWAVEQGITNGTSGDTFSPGDTVNRAQAMTFLYRAVKAQDVGGGNPFADVPDSAYFAGPVRWAVSRGITDGTSPTTFSPNQGCTRGHIITFLYRAS